MCQTCTAFFFCCLYSFIKILIWGQQILYSFVKKNVHFGTNTIANEFKTKGQCAKAVQLFSLVVQLLIVVQLSKTIDMGPTEFVQL